MSLNISNLRGQELAKKLGEIRTQYVKEREVVENNWQSCISEIMQFQACFYRACYCCPASSSSRPVRKKGSLKPSKPLTDKERDQIIGSQSSNSEDEKVTTTKKTKKVAKKKKSRAPNAIRKTKKPARL